MPRLTVAAYQGPALDNNVPHALQTVVEIAKEADASAVDILCFPECFLQGYILDSKKAESVAIALDSDVFLEILNRLKDIRSTIILGMVEQEADRLFNTAAIIDQGNLSGKYRKQHLLDRESLFAPGNDLPVFQKHDTTYGVNICYDARFPDSARSLANQGASAIFYLLNNRLSHKTAEKWRLKHGEILQERARETACWIISADVTDQTPEETGYGYTTIIDPTGNVMQKQPDLTQGLIIKHID